MKFPGGWKCPGLIRGILPGVSERVQVCIGFPDESWHFFVSIIIDAQWKPSIRLSECFTAPLGLFGVLP